MHCKPFLSGNSTGVGTTGVLKIIRFNKQRQLV